MSQFDIAKPGRVCRPRRALRHVAIFLAAALSVALLARAGLRDSVEASESVIEKDAVGKVTLIVSADETTLDFSGPIVFGVMRRVLAVLVAHPSISTVRLTSAGGRVVEARDLSQVIGERGLSTIAVDTCASACTIMFMAGRDRLLAPTSTLGFHRYHSPDPEQEEAEANMAVDRRYFSARGIPDWFIDRAFTTPNSGMWRPSPNELIMANVITGELTVEGERIAVAARPASDVRAAATGSSEGARSVNASEQPR